MHTRSKILSLSGLFLSICVHAAITLPGIIGSNMVLQRGGPIPVWGWAAPGRNITVRFAGQERRAIADASGRWEVRLGKLPASSEPREMSITTDRDAVTLTNILVGEVWLCSGQSNMEKPIGEQRGQKPVFNFREELSAARYPEIRLLKIPKTRSASPATNVEAAWFLCSSNSLEQTKFSATGYFFGREIFHQLHVPVGLIDSTWGGTRIEPWTPEEGFKLVKSLAVFTDTSSITNQRIGVSRLFNGMIAPLTPFAIRGTLWYQGESNLMDVNDGLNYVDKMKALVFGWRKVWGSDFPFFYVQIAPYCYHADRPTRVRSAEGLPLFWEAQTLSLQIPKTGMVVTTDITDDLHDIHPRDKQDVGDRLARLALARVYGRRNVVWSGPMYRSMKVRDGKAVLSFTHTEGGLKSKDGKPLTWFTIAGDDGKFLPAEAVVKGDTVIVSNPSVKSPKTVRFAWAETAQPNLANGAGLPAIPFRTDGPGRTK